MESNLSVRKVEWIALTGFGLQLLATGVMFALASWSRSLALFMESWHFLGGLGLWLLLYVHLNQQRLAQEERLQAQLPAARHFEEQLSEVFSARHRLEQMEKWFIPLMTLVAAVVFVFVGILGTRCHPRGALQHHAPCMAFLGGVAFVAFIFAKYVAGLGRHWPPLRAGSSYLFGNALVTFGIMLALALLQMGIAWPEQWLARLLPWLSILLGSEFLLNFVLEFYRPRLAQGEVRPLYSSRLLEMLTGQATVLKSVAHALDYQFGFKVSRTWFWRFMEKAVAPLVLFQLAALYLGLCVVVIDVHEGAVLERYGRYVQTWGPGLHFKWPWPFEQVYRYPVGRIQMFTFGEEGHEHGQHDHQGHHHHHHHHAHQDSKPHAPHAVLYSQAHAHKTYMLLIAQKTSGTERSFVPVNILNVNINLYYRIRKLRDYVYNHASPQELLQGIAYRELTRLTASSDLMGLMAQQRRQMEQRLQAAIQRTSDQMALGLEILMVAIQHTHPPIKIFPSFEAVISAMEQKARNVIAARRDQARMVIRAQAQARRIISSAGISRMQKGELTAGEAHEFQAIRTALQSGGQIYLYRKYLKLLEAYLPASRLYLLTRLCKGSGCTRLNLEDLWQGGSLDLQEGSSDHE